MNTDYKMNPDISKLVQPRSESELEKLSVRINADPEFRTIEIWNGFHLNDGDKYSVCMKGSLQYQVFEKSFKSIYNAAAYVCAVQLKRQDLSDEYRKYLIGEWFDNEQKAGFISDKNQQASKRSLAIKIGKETGLVAGTVLKYYSYSLAVNMIFSQSEKFAKSILTGKVKVSHENVIEISRLAPDEIISLEKAVNEDKLNRLTFSDIRHEIKWRHTTTRAAVSRREKSEQKKRPSADIRQMPEYDPDAEVNSLCMTISAWINSIERANQKIDYSNITGKAKLELMKQLTILDRTITNMQKALVERTVQ